MSLYVLNSYRLKKRTPSRVLDEYREALTELVAYIRESQPDTWLYTVMEVKDSPLSFTHLAVYKDEAARHVHESAPIINRTKSIIKDWLVDPPGFVATEFTAVASQSVFSK